MTEAKPATFERRFAHLLVPAAVLSYFLQPLIRYASPQTVLALGLLIVVAYLSNYFVHIRTTDENVRLGIGNLGLFAFGGMWIYLISITGAQSSSNDRRCIAIQHHMLTTVSSRADDAAMMQALGCRPQGDEMPHYADAPPSPRLPYLIDRPPFPQRQPGK